MSSDTKLNAFGCVLLSILWMLWIFGIPWIVMVIFNHFSERLDWNFILRYWETFGALFVISVLGAKLFKSSKSSKS